MSVEVAEKMLSLKDYLGKAVGQNGIGLQVFEMSKAQGVISEIRRVDGRTHDRVRVYPESFLLSIDDFLTPYKK
jgi:hypothetical protein